jgi:DNA-binding transcriptional regulator GbsR (MarR family)
MATSKMGRIQELKERLRKLNAEIEKNPSSREAKRRRKQLSNEIDALTRTLHHNLEDFLEK